MAGQKRLMRPTKNKTLKRIVRDIEKNVPPKFKEAYLATVVIAKKILFDAKTSGRIMKDFNAQVDEDASDIPNATAQLVMDTMGLVYGESKQSIPPEALLLASVPVAASVLQYVETSLKETLPKELIGETMKSVIMNMMTSMGLDVETMEGLTTGEIQGGAEAPPAAPEAMPTARRPPLMEAMPTARRPPLMEASGGQRL